MPRGIKSVIVIDHNPVLLEGIICLISAELDMVLAGAATDLDTGLALALAKSADCVVIDLDLHPAAGYEVLAKIRQFDPKSLIIGLITYELDARVPEARAAGASAVLGKDQISQRLVELIRNSSRAS
jgi:DNA-binding NarL/FixJ family response regulator